MTDITRDVSGDVITIDESRFIPSPTGGFRGQVPGFKAYLSSDQAFSGSTFTKVELDTEVYDYESVFDNVTNHRFTVPVGWSGRWLFNAKVSYLVAADEQSIHAILYKNGAILEGGFSRAAGTATQIVGQSIVVDLDEGDYIELYGYSSSADSFDGIATDNRTSLTGHYVDPIVPSAEIGIRGQINGTTGIKSEGSGFVSARTETGVYTVTFDVEMPDNGYNVDNSITSSSAGHYIIRDRTTTGFTIKTYNAAGTATDKGSLFSVHYGSRDLNYTEAAISPIVLKDVKSTGTAGGTATQDAWYDRVLNTKEGDELGIATLSSNHVTVPLGKYWVVASAPFYEVNAAKMRLYDETGTATLLSGGPLNANVVESVNSQIRIDGLIDLSVESELSLQYYCQSTKTSNGLGTGFSGETAEGNVFAQLTLIPINPTALGIIDAPEDGLDYARSDGEWVRPQAYKDIGIRGDFNTTGTVQHGSGFTVTHVSTGVYDVNFDVDFPDDTYTILSSATGSGLYSVVSGQGGANKTVSKARIKTYNSSAAATNSGVNFKAFYGQSDLNYTEAAVSPIVLRDVKSNGTTGGATVATTWTDRVLNTETGDDLGICTLSANHFTLPAGKYLVQASAPFFRCNGVKLRFYDETNTASLAVAVGNADEATAGEGSTATIFLSEYLDLSAPTEISLQYWANDVNSNGLGPPLGSETSVENVFSQVMILPINPAAVARAANTLITDVLSTDAAKTMEVWKHYIVNISGWAANRDWTIPTTAAVGDRIRVQLSSGDDAYELVLKTPAGVTVTSGKLGTAASTEITRLFIDGEYLEFICTVANTTWTVIDDGRIAQEAIIQLASSITSITPGTTYDLAFGSGDVITDIGDITDPTNDKVTVRRAGTYDAFGGFYADDIDSPYVAVGSLWKNHSEGSPQVFARHSDYSQGTGRSMSMSVSGSDLLVAGDYITLIHFTNQTNTYDLIVGSSTYNGYVVRERL